MSAAIYPHLQKNYNVYDCPNAFYLHGEGNEAKMGQVRQQEKFWLTACIQRETFPNAHRPALRVQGAPTAPGVAPHPPALTANH